MSTTSSPSCLFCQIIHGERKSQVVFESEETLAFLDRRPLFPGHCLIVPKEHYATLLDLPEALLRPLFSVAQLLARALEQGLGAEGSFVAVNNRISQSVPHLHIHVVPRRHKDGLKGFFWPRHAYADETERAAVAARIRELAARQRVPRATLGFAARTV